MPKHKNEDANAASPFLKTVFCAAFSACFTLNQRKMHLTIKDHRFNDAPETADLHPHIKLFIIPLPSEKIRILKSHFPHSVMHKFNIS